jgi:hypothetical protein
MPILIPNVGENRALNLILNKATPENWTFRLFQNNITPAETDTSATYTEATWTGYSFVSLAAASWTVSGTTQAAYPEQTFTSTAGSQNQTNYGYYYLSPTSTVLMGVERFSDAPYTIVNNGDQIKITPILTLD